jgi:predicted dehydrogenase
MSGAAITVAGSSSQDSATAVASKARRQPRLACLGTGWIGRHRLEAVRAGADAQIVALCDPEPDAAERAGACAPEAARVPSIETLFDLELDGVLIATPSALHAQQSIALLERGIAVFCQKPLARSLAETRCVLDAARRADRLLEVDLSYRHTRGMARIRELIAAGELGDVFAADLVFHNAYGPDKSWFRDPALSGGGCVMDLGIHLVDLALWTLDWPQVRRVSSRLFAQGRPLVTEPCVEDYAVAELELESGALVRLACSWNLSAGRDAVIEASFHGTRGGTVFRNVQGSFYDFIAEHHVGTHSRRLVEPPDAWGGRAAVAWTRSLSLGGGFDPAIEHIAEVAKVLDAIYGR